MACTHWAGPFVSRQWIIEKFGEGYALAAPDGVRKWTDKTWWPLLEVAWANSAEEIVMPQGAWVPKLVQTMPKILERGVTGKITWPDGRMNLVAPAVYIQERGRPQKSQQLTPEHVDLEALAQLQRDFETVLLYLIDPNIGRRDGVETLREIAKRWAQ